MAEELAEVCKDYCQEVWAELLNQAGVLVVSEWRKAENIFYPVDICEVLAALPPPAIPAPSSSEQPPTTLAPLRSTEVPTRLGKTGDQG